MASFSDSATGRIKAKADSLPYVASLVLHDFTGGTRIHLMADADHVERFRLAAAAINGELGRALAAFVAEYDEMTCDLEGRNPLIDSGCIDCTAGTVPNDKNTGRCLYHLAKEFGIEAPRPTTPIREEEFDPTATGGRAEGGA